MTHRRSEPTEVEIRTAAADDVETVVLLLRRMIEALEAMGHDRIRQSDDTWAFVAERVRGGIEVGDHLFLLVEARGEAVGVLEARLENAGPVFDPKQILHISAVYIAPPHRRKGIARQLLEQAFAWGTARGCEAPRLRTLVANPARRLYSALGFREFQVEMRRAL